MEKAISYLKVLPETTQELQSFYLDVKNTLMGGNENPLDFMRNLKAMEMLLKMLSSDKEIKELVIQEAEKYDKKFDYKNVSFELSQRRTFDYTNCDDYIFNDSSEKMDFYKEKIKERQTFLKSLKEPVFDETGTQINPPIYKVNDIITVKFK